MSDVFRKVSLERLSSPEQLDQLIQVTHPRGWVALAAFGVLILAALAWGVFGSIPTEAAGQGILLRGGGVTELVSAASGQVEEILVAVGDELEKGQVVARIRQDALLRQIADTEARVGDLRKELADLAGYVDEQKRLAAANEAQERSNLERRARTLERQVALVEERLGVERELLADGLVTQQTLLASEQEENATRDELAAVRLEIGGLELRRLEEEQRLDQELTTRRSALRDAELELRELRASREENAFLVARGPGRVLELLADRGDVVSPGTPLLSMEVASDELVAVIFVPAELGKRVRRGMEARVVPSTVRREEHGFMLGEVRWVAEFPATARGMERLLANQELVARLMQEGPPIQVDVTLHRDAATPTGYRWSSAHGPAIEISSGTLASGSVIVRRVRPISLVIPRIREELGI